MSTSEAVLVQKCSTGAFERLCWYKRVLQSHSGGCAGAAEYYRSTC